MPSLFRRKSADLVSDAVPAVAPDEPSSSDDSATARPKGYTPSKRELGKVTPKRSSQARRVEPPPANRKEAMKRAREKERAARAEQRAGMMAGDERYLLARDRGGERALVRDIVDSRRTVGTYFFGGALIVLIGSSSAMPPAVRLGANLLWVLLAVATVLDSVLIARKIRKLVRERFPKYGSKLGSLYFYGIMRALSFRRMRIPRPRVGIGAKI